MKNPLTTILLLTVLHVSAQTDSVNAVEEIKAFQHELNESYKDQKKSPLTVDDFFAFEGHDFYPIDLDYRVNAALTLTEGTPFFAMKTTSTRLAQNRIYGYVSFTLKGKDFRLPVYQSQDAMQHPEYADHLFFPFTDQTNGVETYGGGRYIDLRIPKEGNNIVVDFNMAYNPYCAYSSRYSCPIVPAENQMDIAIPAGVRYKKKEKSGEGPPYSIADELDVQPEYPGGYSAMIRFIRNNIKYPKKARKEKIEGTVYISFVVAPDGLLTDIKTLKGISPECDQEAERAVALMPPWKPGQHNGKNVYVRFVLPIQFKR